MEDQQMDRSFILKLNGLELSYTWFCIVRRHVAQVLDCVALEAPVVTFGFLKHLLKGAFPFSSLFILLFDPQRYLHHSPRNIPVAPQRFNCFVIIPRSRGLVE